MAKDKKKGSEAKKAKKAEKAAKQASKGEKKAKTKAARAEGSDGDDVDIDQVLDDYRRQQELLLKVTETVCDEAPRPRAASTLLAAPHDSNSLLLFGGEYFDGSLARFYNDLHIYNVARHEWRCVTSPNAPLPRSGHAWTRASHPGMVYLFGGEFSSPKQGTFHHYSDFWRLEPATREWTKIEPRAKHRSPPARSGHRMTHWKQYIVLFGGFQDTSNQTRYLADLWIFDTVNYVWHCPALPQAQLKPEARSSFSLLPCEQGAVLFGGYSRVKPTGALNSNHKNVLVPKVHDDCFFLRMSLPPAHAPPDTPPGVRWERRKKPANMPNPSRAGATMTWHKGRGILFGGVHDVEQSQDAMDSEFFNNLFAWNVQRNRFMPLGLRKPPQPKRPGLQQRLGRRGRAQANQEELLRQLAALETGTSLENADDIKLELEQDPAQHDHDNKPARDMPVTTDLPHVRFNSQLAVQDDVLYIYGGTYEKGDREYTFDDLYAIDLSKLDGCKEIFSRPVQDWVESEDDEDEDEEDEEDAEDEENDQDDEPDDNEAQEARNPPLASAKSSTKEDALSDTCPETPATAMSVNSDEHEAETTAPWADDGLPHPRPFETRRDFFVRTSAEWQKVVMAKARYKGSEGEALTTKEIKTKAFELSEEKWWDCREEITRLEEEQEAAGIDEVVSLAERGDGAAGGGARRR
ncbi:hypothetical protein CDD82_4478 [Ophiocordyceps australis]|uniref:DUF4110 domain-containing protein n=1 Tax=Ophiocordyceps australis TaxID=1399860 RepID=A0A2C5Z2W6_9HYPO|nr:hypothetical protein CDD82_4478 [Ophiocordyceps australis]